jgi:hypothetical protein
MKSMTAINTQDSVAIVDDIDNDFIFITITTFCTYLTCTLLALIYMLSLPSIVNGTVIRTQSDSHTIGKCHDLHYECRTSCITISDEYEAIRCMDICQLSYNICITASR